MPKEARNDAAGIYYVRVYGYRNCPVFLKDQDKEAYIKRIYEYRIQTGIRIYAFLIEDNTAHLILETQIHGQMSDFMKRMGISYSRYFRKCYAVEDKRIFRDRYISEKIEDRKKLLGLVRVLHKDKEKHIRPFSSHQEYYRLEPKIDTRMILDEIRYAAYESERNHSEKMMLREKIERGAYSDAEVRIMLQKACNKIREEEPLIDTEICLDQAVRILVKDKRISVRQLARVSGFSKSKVDRLRQIFS